jgi:hypothetical protein
MSAAALSANTVHADLLETELETVGIDPRSSSLLFIQLILGIRPQPVLRRLG